ncbi:MAG: tetratricopeptide repeat protein [Myxococcales bacterium]|nr:tetratricopeptide repeat protein [Myxococcales bacterium]
MTPERTSSQASGGGIGARLRAAAPYAGIVVSVFVAYGPGLTGGWLRWDDDRLAYENPLVGPPYLANTARMFGAIQNEAWQPLHTASYQIDHALWGLHPFGSHLFNLALYALGACLLLVFLRRLGAPVVAAAAGVLLFALHPSHVESVVWVSGRKDVLSLVFVALSLVLYARSARPFDRRHLAAAGCFVLAALTKTTVLFLPLWLPLLDRWALRLSWRTALRRAAPLAAVAAALGALVTWIWHAEGLTRTLGEGGSRFALAPKVLLHYAATLVWPADLSPLYPIDRAGVFDGRSAAGLLLLVALLGLAWTARRAVPAVALGVALFLLGLLPVSNLIPMTFQVNDRYLLLPSFGLALAVWGYAGALEGRVVLRRLLLGVAAAAALACGALSFSYSFAWRSDDALWTHAVEVQPGAYYAWMKLGETRRDAGRFDEADAAYARAVDLEPGLLPARGGRMLNCLVRENAERRRERPMPLGLSGRYLQAWGNARAMLDVAVGAFTGGYEDCAFRILMEATEQDPPLADDLILAVARDWLNLDRSDRALALLDRVTPAGRKDPRWADLRARATAPPQPR